jgi:flagellin-like protein
MIKKKMNAVSPLIATILLVAVALSLAGILYSWSSQSARETTDSTTETINKWSECNHVKLSIDIGCTYDSTTNGLRLVLMDQSTVEITEDLTVMITDANSTIATTTVESDFSNRAMQIRIDDEDFLDLESPVKARVFINSCPEQFATATCR